MSSGLGRIGDSVGGGGGGQPGGVLHEKGMTKGPFLKKMIVTLTSLVQTLLQDHT